MAPPRSEPDGLTELYTSLLTHSFGSPPVIGLIHHVRQRAGLDWPKSAGGVQGVGIHPAMHSTTTEEYSFSVNVSAESKQGGGSHALSSTWSRDYTWNDEVW